MLPLILLVLAAIRLQASPSGMEAKSGSAKLLSAETLLQIEADDRSILEWREFSIEAGETVRFVQPDARALVLNRVLGESPSSILGALEANGRVVLLNPNGVFFGRESRIDTGALIASTFDLIDSDFLAGRFELSGDSAAAVVNEGKISASEVYLAAARVEQNGIVHASSFAGIVAGGILINEKGMERAFRIPQEATAQVSGSIVSPETVVLGDSVALLDGALIDAGNGKARIGGDFQGHSPNWFNARNTFVSERARIRADGMRDAGSVVVWSDESTRFYGSASAQGGAFGGDGGMIEISGKQRLDFQGLASAAAPCGKTGTLLLDPPDITIQVAGATSGSFSACLPPSTYTPGVAADILTVASLTGALAGCNVVVNAATGNITVNGAVGWATGSTLTLNAGGNIAVNANVLASGVGAAITLTAGGGITVTDAEVANTAISPGAAVAATANTGDITLTANNFNARIGNQFGTVTVTALTGSIYFQFAPAGPAASTIGAVIGSLTGMSMGGDISVAAGTDIIATLPNVGNQNFLTAGICRVGINDMMAGTITGNISATAGRDIQLIGANDNGLHSLTFALIGHGWNGAVARTVTGDVTVNAGRDLILQAGGREGQFHRALIGNEIEGDNAGNTNFSHLTVNVGRDMTLTTRPTVATGDTASVGGGDSARKRATTLHVNVARDLLLDGRLSRVEFLASYGDTLQGGYAPETIVHAGGNITLLGGNSPPGTENTARISFGEVQGGIPLYLYNYELWAGGSILCYNGNQTGSNNTTGSVFFNANSKRMDIDLRAGGDLIVAAATAMESLLNMNGSSSLFIEADHCFASSELWTAQSANLNGSGANVFAGSILGSNSPALANNGLGGFAFDATSYTTTNYGSVLAPFPVVGTPLINLNYSNVSGNISILSADTFVGDVYRPQFSSPNMANFTISTATPNNYGVITSSGDIVIGGNTASGSCPAQNSFNNVTIAAASIGNPWTSGSIYLSANNDLTQNDDVRTSGVSEPITMIADNNDTGSGVLTINANVQTNMGKILFDSGFGAAGGSSSIQQIGTAQVSSFGGDVTFQSSGNTTINGGGISVLTLGGNFSSTSTDGTITVNKNVQTIGGDAVFDAGVDVIVTGGGLALVSTDAGILTMDAGSDIEIDGSANTLITTSGLIDLDAGRDILITGNIVSLTGTITTLAGDNTTLMPNVGSANVLTSNAILMITGNNMSLSETANISSSGSSVTLVVDNDFPAPPLIGNNIFFSMTATTQVNAATTLRIYTARQPYNTILGTLNGQSFMRGTLFEDTPSEVWCTYYPNFPAGNAASPFTVFYKDCLQQATEEATEIVVQLLTQQVDTFTNPNFPYYGVNEYYGWPSKFIIFYRIEKPDSTAIDLPHEPYFLRRRNELLIAPRPPKERDAPGKLE